MILNAVWHLLRDTWLTPIRIPPLLKELIIFSLSYRNGSNHCQKLHAHMLLQMDKSLKLDQLITLAEQAEFGLFPDNYNAAIKFCLKIAMDFSKITDEDLAELRKNGFNDEELIELLMICTMAYMLNIVSITSDLPPDPLYA